MLKRFLIFKHEDFHPLGGWNDFSGSFDTKLEALANLSSKHGRSHSSSAHLVDTTTAEVKHYKYFPEGWQAV